MTLTNHTVQICKLAGMVNGYADKREYEKAHCALDDIEKKVHELRRHIDHLQFVNYFDIRTGGKGI